MMPPILVASYCRLGISPNGLNYSGAVIRKLVRKLSHEQPYKRSSGNYDKQVNPVKVSH